MSLEVGNFLKRMDNFMGIVAEYVEMVSMVSMLVLKSMDDIFLELDDFYMQVGDFCQEGCRVLETLARTFSEGYRNSDVKQTEP